MLRSNRGAARVSIVWIIVAGVMFLVAVVFAFVASSDLTKERDAKEVALADKAQAETLANEASDYARKLSEAVGWYDAESANPRANIDLVTAAVSELRDTFTDLGADDTDFEKALPKLRAAYTARGRQIGELETRVQGLQSELTVKDNTIGQITSEKQGQIDELRSQLADETQSAASRNEELERRLATANQNLSEKDVEFRRAENTIADNTRAHEKEKLAMQTRMNELANDLKFSKDPFSNYPDGKVVSMSDKLGLGWIDIGSEQRLVRGVRFRVESGTAGSRKLKGMVEVVKVEAKMAEVAVVSLVDTFSPIVSGDVIINPLYDPTGGRNAILVGRFSGAFNEKELTLLLNRMGINVQKSYQNTTHFMIVGSEIYTDMETGEPLEDPIQPSDLPEYKDAVANAVQVIPLQDIREFFKVDTRTSEN